MSASQSLRGTLSTALAVGKDRGVRILWMSDSPDAPSGFGMVTREVCGGLAQRGHDIEILGWQTRATTTRWQNIPVRPVQADAFGADVLVGYLLRFQPDVVITLADIWWMTFMTDPPVQRYLDQSGCRWVLYYPLDGATPDGCLPPGWVRVLETADVAVAMSRFGQEVARSCGIDALYVPHGCDTEVFAPPGDRERAKARLGYEGKFVVLSDARNQPRKLLPRLLDIAATFEPWRQDVVFHLHTDPQDSSATSELYHYDLLGDIAALGLAERVRLTARFRMRTAGGLSVGELAGIYQAADVHLLTSWGEGFGLPTLQAASSGLVPMAVAYSASRELVEGHGVALPTESEVVDEFGLRRCLIDRGAAVEALRALEADRPELALRQTASRAFALPYAWTSIVDQWERVLSGMALRRRPDRSGGFEWIGGAGVDRRNGASDIAVSTATEAFGRLPEGATVSVRMAERRFGEVAAAVHADTFRDGDFISVPVRLPVLVPGAPRPAVGNVLASPSDLPVVGQLKRILPGLTVSVPKPPDDPTGERFLSLEELIPALVHYTLVLDLSGEAPAGTDVACAAVGVPYLGPSSVWPPLHGSPTAKARALLTDPGLSSRRRDLALVAVEQAVGEEFVARIRAFALAAQPDPEETARRRSQDPPEDVETLIVRLQPGAGAAERQTVAGLVTANGGLVLMVTGSGSLLVLVPAAAKAVVEGHPLVAFAGGISLDDDAPGAKALKRVFADNAARQLTARQRAPSQPLPLRRSRG